MSKLKMHIVLRWDLSAQAAIVAASHASLGTYLTFKNNPLMQEWQRTSFIKILHRPLNREHWENCKKFGEHRVFTESSLGNLETAIGFDIIRVENIYFKDLPLWTLNPQE